MVTKKYFHDSDPTIVNTSDAAALEKDAESLEHVKVYIQQKDRFVPHTDFVSASNFVFFGSAEQYYDDAISGYSNYFDLSENRESNLKIDGADGNTVEFWMKKAQQVPDNYKEVVFDTYTVNASNDNSLTSGYGRLRIELEGTDASTSPWLVTYLSGTYGFSTASIGQSVTETTVMDDKWHHYAFVFQNNESNLQAKLQYQYQY